MFYKTNTAISTQSLTQEEATAVVSTMQYEVGQVHPDDPNMVWDGERWTPKAEWESRAIPGEV